MQSLSPGSVICFGSTRHGQFWVDTVFVIATAQPWAPDQTAGLDLDEAFLVCTAQPLTAWTENCAGRAAQRRERARTHSERASAEAANPLTQAA